MSDYHGRVGPNFTQYINDLNTIPQPFDQDLLPSDDLNLDQELALFTNADFTNLDSLGPLPDGALNFDLGGNNKSSNNDFKYEDLLASATSPSTDTQPPNAAYFPNFPHPIQPAPPNPTHSQGANFSPSEGSSSLPQDSLSHSAGLKPKGEPITSASQQQPPPEQHSRLAAEEDKRRRNTAASARFRVKKKQREQALERTVKEVNDKNTALEAKVDQLEMENKWLKNLITEKNGKQTKEEIAEAYQKFRRESEERETSRVIEHKESVGTRS